MDIQIDLTNLDQIPLDILFQIVKYLDPKSIGQLVLVSRNTRLRVGQILNKCLNEQKKYYQNIKEQSLYAKNYFQYKELLQQIQIFLDDQIYTEFVNLINVGNKNYFVNFFSAVFNFPIKFHEGINYKKQELINRHKEVFTSLFLLSKSYSVPKLENKHIFLKCQEPKLEQIVGFANNFLSKLSALHKMDNLLDALIIFQQQKWLYLNTYSNIMAIKIKEQYKQKVYYLKFENTYHKIINFNINSVVLSFLDIKNLQKLRFVDKMFNSLVKKISLINYKHFYINIERMFQQLTLQKELYDLYSLINQNRKIKMTMYQFITNNLSVQFPVQIDKLFNIFLICLGYQPQHVTIQQFQNSSKFYAQVFENTQAIQLNESTYGMLEQFFKEENVQQIKAFNILSNKICTQLELLYLTKKYQISQKAIDNYCEKMQQISDKIDYALKFRNYSKLIKNS
ncbi:hypothetical protein ABPG72_020192 [Tetrahymena utriculariae]